jgi:hypothetical protein
MAKRVQIELISDLDGGPADETVHFAIDGTNYEIDLSADDAGALRRIFKQYVKAGGKASAVSARGKAAPTAPAGSSREASRKIREWAKENGYSVSERGRISSEIVEAYRKAVS